MGEQSNECVRVAMWSGPRNISTAMMRSWSSRADTAVIDEPLYAHYLGTLNTDTRAAHPCADEVIASQPTDWRTVVDRLTGNAPGGASIWYQKHMAHHLTSDIDLGWLDALTSCILIRDPAEMIASYTEVIDDPSPQDLGLPQQTWLFETIRERTGTATTVIDSRDVLKNPRGMIESLCSAVGVAFDEAMLSWEPGPRPEDGVWAPHWYSSVYASTGFAPYKPKNRPIPPRLEPVLAECRADYDRLAAHRLTA